MNTMIRGALLVIFAIFLHKPAFCQQDKIVLPLGKEPAALFKSYKFFIEDVEDKRLIPSASLGKVIALGKEVPVMLPGKADRELFNYWSFAAPKKDQNALPLYVTIKDLSLNEKRVAPNKVTGEVKLQVNFRWYRNMQPVELTSYQTSATYTRPER